MALVVTSTASNYRRVSENRIKVKVQYLRSEENNTHRVYLFLYTNSYKELISDLYLGEYIISQQFSEQLSTLIEFPEDFLKPGGVIEDLPLRMLQQFSAKPIRIWAYRDFQEAKWSTLQKEQE